jgi:hypothetical protein
VPRRVVRHPPLPQVAAPLSHTRTLSLSLSLSLWGGAAFEKEMVKIFAELPPRLATSASTGHGKDQTLRYLASLRALYADETAPPAAVEPSMEEPEF